VGVESNFIGGEVKVHVMAAEPRNSKDDRVLTQFGDE
jgi:hypothetical protein